MAQEIPKKKRKFKFPTDTFTALFTVFGLWFAYQELALKRPRLELIVESISLVNYQSKTSDSTYTNTESTKKYIIQRLTEIESSHGIATAGYVVNLINMAKETDFLSSDQLRELRFKVSDLVQHYRKETPFWLAEDIRITSEEIIWPDSSKYPYANDPDAFFNLGREVKKLKGKKQLTDSEMDSLKNRAYYLYMPFDSQERKSIAVKLQEIREITKSLTERGEKQIRFDVNVFNLSASPNIIRKNARLSYELHGKRDTLILHLDENIHIHEHGHKIISFTTNKIQDLEGNSSFNIDSLLRNDFDLRIEVADLKKKPFHCEAKVETGLKFKNEEKFQLNESLLADINF